MLPIFLKDYYKTDHKRQYPKGTTLVYSNLTPRSSRMPGIDRVVVFGLQYFLQKYLIEEFDKFFSVPKRIVLSEYKRIMDNTLGPNAFPLDHIESLWDLGYLPLEIKALSEGSLCPLRVPFLTIRNTEPEFFWLTNFLETILCNIVWQPITSATIAFEYRKLLQKYANETSDIPEFVTWQGHDFSMRGMSSLESSITSGMAHLLSFAGTDTIPAILGLEQYYGADVEKEIVGASVSASEHSIMTFGGINGEKEIIKRLITEIYPKGIVSIVMDSYDYFKNLTETLVDFKDIIMSRDGKVVVRPDCYDDQTQILTDCGWKYFSDILDTDMVAQVLDDGTYEFVKPIEYVDHYYEGDMIHFYDYHGKLDILVTPNHRMIYTKNGNIKVETAEKIKVGAWGKDFIRSARAKDKNTGLTPIERLKIAFQADGSYCSGVRSSIRFSFSKDRKISRLKSILEDCGFPYKIYPLSDGKVEFNIKCNADDFSKDFEWVDTSNLCSNWCCEFIDELSNWDGSIRHEDRIKFDTTNKSVIDVVELISLSSGYGVLISRYEDDRQIHFNDVYTAHILMCNLIGGQSHQKEIRKYIGKVYCVKVPSGKLLVKRNRCTLVSGNSGDPVKIICGDPEGKTEAEKKGSVQLLWDLFGGTKNSKGYKQLDPHIGLIYGDSITLDRCEAICKGLKSKGFASTNMVYGIGSYTYQYNTRDTFGLAMKATYGEINGVGYNIFKDPKTDNGVKRSAKGLLRVNEDYTLTECCSWHQECEGLLTTVFLDGKLERLYTLSEIRSRLLSNLED